MERTVKPLIMEGDRPFLPDDIIVNILKRLSVKFLLRFQCVCKHWKNLIKTPSFIAAHLHHSRHQNPSLFLSWPCLTSSASHWAKLDVDMRELVVQNSPLIDSLRYFHLCGSSNGLLCVKGRSINSILLWNPATREIRQVSTRRKRKREIRQVPRTVNRSRGLYHIGFGFSPIVNDYKIVKIYYAWKEGIQQVNQVEVYSLSTKSWKDIGFGNLEGVCGCSETVSANGVMFWFGVKATESVDDDGLSVVSFDIANEIFTVIPMPPTGARLMRKLAMYENNLALLCVKWTTQHKYTVELWVMEEGLRTSGERWTWTNKYASNLCQGLLDLCPYTIWGNEIVCKAEVASDVEDDGRKTFLYLFNLAKDELKTFGIDDYDRKYGLLVDNYIESLVSIDTIHVDNP